MQPREVTDQDNITWSCVQAYTGSNGRAAEIAAKIATDADGSVTVVCTPNGGAQTLRISMPIDWHENKKDSELLDAIEKHQHQQA